MRRATISLIASVGLMCLPAGGQETTGAVVGVITSPDTQPLPGVDVRLVNPATGLERVRRTGPEGRYQFAALPPASYELTASLDGFRAVRRSVKVDLGRTVTVNLRMEIGSFSETIDVTGELPLIDVTSTVSGLTVNADELMKAVPVQREVTQVALLAPGTFPADNLWQQPARIGLHTPGQGFASFNGSSYGESSFLINGLNVTDFRRMMGSTFVPMEFVDEVQVKTGGYEAEFGRATGGVVNMVTKSGTNTLRGSVSAYWEPESLQEQEPDTFRDDNQQERRESLEVNASLGGPVVRDRLFYFAFVRYSDTAFTDVYSGFGVADLHEASTPYWGGKLDWNPAPSHRLEGTYLSDDVDVDFVRSDYDPDTQTMLDVRGTGVRSRGGGNAILKYTGVLTDSLLLAAQAGRNEFDRTNFSDGDECPYAVDDRGEASRYPGCWVRSSRGSNNDTREAYRLDLDWFVGDHSLRAGVDTELNQSRSTVEFSGGVFYYYILNGSPEQTADEYRYPELPWDQDLVRERHYSVGGTFDVISRAAYLQDSWSVTPNLTLNLGVRWESYANQNGLGQTFIETDDQWAPRVGVIWDPTGAGRAKLYASYGTYHLPVSSEASITLAGATFLEETWYTFDGSLAADGSPTEFGDELEHVVFLDGVVADPQASIAENFDPMSQDEVIVGYQQMVGDRWTVGVRGVARWYGEVIEDFTLDEGLWDAYGVPCLDPDLLGTGAYCYNEGWRLGNPGSDFAGWFDIDRDGVLDPVRLTSEQLDYPPAERDHYALELTVQRRLADGWMLQGSYTWSHTYGNYEGTVSDEFANDLAGITQAFDWPYHMEHAAGDLPSDRRHSLKLFGMYAWNGGFQVGGNLYYLTGRPISSWGRHPTDPWAHATNLLAHYADGAPTPRACCGRTDDIWGLDLLFEYEFETADITWSARLDVFNVTDNSDVDRVWMQAELATNGVPDANFLQPTYYQAPRTVRLGFGLSF